MIARLVNILKLPKRYYTVLISESGGTVEYQLMEIHHNDDELNIKGRIFSCDFNEVVNDKLNNDCPVILHLEGDNIINKVVEKKPGYRKSLIFNSDPNEFCFFEYQQKATLFVSVIRKKYLDTIIKRITDNRFYVVHLSFGPFVMANLLSVVNNEYNSISSPNYTLELKNGEILSFSKKQTLQGKYEIQGDTFNTRELPLLAAFLDYKYPNPKIEFDNTFLDRNKKEVYFKRWFKIAGVITLAFFLVTIPLSHLMMEYYSKSLAERESLKVMSQQTIAQVNALKAEKKLKEKILLSSGINQKQFLTRYVMDVGNSVPEGMTLNSVQVIPPLKKKKAAVKMTFDIGTIKVAGNSHDNKIFNLWLKRLEELTWIKKINIQEYSRETHRDNTFTISIQI